jgi:mRNA-degrading endonuclease toxin of MazEF toxin-antitoxin module
MNKDLFDEWNKEKQEIHNTSPKNFFVNAREIWLTKMGQNIGFEENGKENFLRPVLVVKVVGNMFFTTSLTTRGKDANKFYHKLINIDLENPKYKDSSYLILSQVKVMDKKRFFKNIGAIEKDEFIDIKLKLRELLL